LKEMGYVEGQNVAIEFAASGTDVRLGQGAGVPPPAAIRSPAIRLPAELTTAIDKWAAEMKRHLGQMRFAAWSSWA
jgi:hypothetical protein